MITKLITLSAFVLSGCLATVDLIGSQSTLTAENRLIAERIATTTSERCTRHTYNRNTGEKTSGDVKFRAKPQVKSLLVADNGWYSAMLLTDSVWDYAYLNINTNQFICGEKNWKNNPDSTRIYFKNVLDTQPSLIPTQNSARDKISIPGVIPSNSATEVAPIPSIQSDTIRRVFADGPDISQSGCITPVSLNFSPPMSAGDEFELIAAGNTIAKVVVNRGFLNGFSFRAKMDTSGDVIAKCKMCKITPKFISVTTECRNMTEAEHGSGAARIRTNNNEFKTLISGQLPNSEINVTGSMINLSIYTTKYTADNPYVGVTTTPAFSGEGCVTVRSSLGKSYGQFCGSN